MYTNQSCYVKWGNEHSDSFNVSNGVKQGGVISLQLFSCYIDKIFSQLQHSGLRFHIGTSYAGAFGYADDIALVAPSMQCLKKMLSHTVFHSTQTSQNYYLSMWMTLM